MLEGVNVQRLVRDDFTWADDIPKIARVHIGLNGKDRGPDLGEERQALQAA